MVGMSSAITNVETSNILRFCKNDIVIYFHMLLCYLFHIINEFIEKYTSRTFIQV